MQIVVFTSYYPHDLQNAVNEWLARERLTRKNVTLHYSLTHTGIQPPRDVNYSVLIEVDTAPFSDPFSEIAK